MSKKDKDSMLSDILNRLMFEKKIRATELARELDLPQPTIHRMVTGKSPNPHRSSLEPIAKYFNVTVEQLKGELPLPENLWTESLLPAKKNLTIQVPIIAWDLLPPFCIPTNIKDDKFVACSPDINPDCFAIYMNDSSMEPQFEMGTTLILDPHKALKDRCFALVLMHETKAITFRQVLIDAEYKYLKPLNPDLSAFQMRILDNNDKVLGVLIEARRNYTEF